MSWILLEGWKCLIELKDSWKHEKKLILCHCTQFLSRHPLSSLQQHISLERPFQLGELLEEKIVDVEKGVVYNILDSIFQLYRLAFSFGVYLNKDSYKRIALSIITFPFSLTTRIRLPASKNRINFLISCRSVNYQSSSSSSLTLEKISLSKSRYITARL